MRTRACLTALAVAAAAALISAQGQQRLLQPSDLIEQGSFTIPDMQDADPLASGERPHCEYVQGVIAYNPADDSLFLVCHDWSQTVSEIGIPPLGGVAAIRQGPRDALDGRIGAINPGDPNAKKIGGLLVIGANLLVAAYAWYDANNTARGSHFLRSTDLSTHTVQGPVAVGTAGAGFTSGYMTWIPADWQAAFGGTALAGNCCLNVISRTSLGPAVSVFTPAAGPLPDPTACRAGARVFARPSHARRLHGREPSLQLRHPRDRRRVSGRHPHRPVLRHAGFRTSLLQGRGRPQLPRNRRLQHGTGTSPSSGPTTPAIWSP